MSSHRKPRSLASFLFLFVFVLAAGPVVVFSQITTATIVGTITDPGGAQLPSASVTARNIDTGLTRTVISGEDGNYRIEFLPVGNYVIEVKANSGFKKAIREGIVLRVNDTARIDVPLEIGSVSEEVTVTTAPPEVNTSTAELGRTIQTREIENLPLVERNVYSLLDLTPGVQSNNNGVATASATTSNLSLGFPEQRTLINGGTDGGTGSVNYFLDGGTNMTNLRNTGNILPNPDAIQEFRVQTNSYNAEYGRFANGVINVLTKSGTNKFHGSLYEFVRNEAFNANEWGSIVEKAPFRRNQFGGVIGGPILRDRTFFFGSYSGLRQNTSTFLSGARVPTALERIGNFSASPGTGPRDPATNATFTCNGVSRVICPNRIDPVAAKIINDYIPASNITLSNGLPGWQGNVPNPFNTDEFLVKVDHQLNEPHRLTGSYFTTAGSTTVFPGSGNLPWATQQFKWRQHNVNLSDVWVIDSEKINQVWLTYSRNFGGRLNQPSTSLRDFGSSFVPQGAPSLPQITVTGYFTLTNAIGGPRAGTDLYSMRDVFSWNTGRHSVKIGGELSLNKDIQETLLNNYGVFTFGNAGATSNALANFLIGIPTAVTQDAPVTAYTNTWYTALFVQDDFRVSSRVTLNLGLRWDVQTPPTDPENRVVNYVPGVKSTVNPSAPVGALFYGDPTIERGGIPVSYNHFSPRFGIAWDPFGDGKTSVRAGAGIFYGSISGNEWNTMTNFQPFSTRLTFSNISAVTNAAGVPAGASLSNPYNNYVGGVPFPYRGTFANGGGLFAVAQDFSWPRTFQTNVSVQRQIIKDLTVGVAYVGTIASNLPFGRDVNYPVLTPTATAAGANILSRRPNPLFGAVTVLDSDQDASYHGLQVTSAMRLGEKVSFNAFYTFSKTLSSVQLHNNTTQGLAQNSSKLNLENGRADTDQRHVFSMSMNFRPDFYSGDNVVAKGIINGWSISPIVKIRSGRPFTVTNGGVDANLDGVTGTDRAQLIGDPHLANPTADRWFNTAAFAQNPIVNGVATEGSSARNLLTGPGYKVVDLALSRDFRFNERFKLRLRAEGTNILNLVNYDQPNASVPANVATSTTFGRISSASAMRRLQFGARLTF
ncbi:MAG: TonB-dependent receptor [Acidobacteria bacterium]|nr:TonB-dependent receptor [Acidobacteriota bacterium]